MAVEGTNIPKSIVDLCEKKTTTAFFDGDRGGELILRELLQVADIDYVAFSPRGKSVEDMTKKEVIKTLRNKVPVEYVRDQYFEDAAELPADLLRPARAVPGSEEGDRSDATGRFGAGQKRAKESAPKVPVTIRDHMEDVKGRNVARFLNEDMAVIREIRSEEVEKAVETLDDPCRRPRGRSHGRSETARPAGLERARICRGKRFQGNYKKAVKHPVDENELVKAGSHKFIYASYAPCNTLEW